jgi:hypothetical protein
MALVALHWFFRIVESPGHPFPPWAKALAILLSLRPIMGDLTHGNVNLFILFLVVGGLYAYWHGRDVLAGLLIGLSIACKVTPALFVPYFLWKREWRTLGGCALGLVLFLVVVPGCFLRFDRNLQLLASWTRHMVAPYVVEGKVTSEHANQSLPGLAFRLATQSPSFVDEHNNPVSYHNVAALDPSLVGWFLKGCMAAFAGVVVWACRTPTRERRGWRLAAEFSLIVLGMLLFSERTWKHHCVTLLLPFSVFAYYLGACRPGPWLRAYLIGSLVVVMLLISSTSTSLLDGLDSAAKMAQVYGAYVWAYLVLVAALVILLRRPDEPTPVPVGQPESDPVVSIPEPAEVAA